MQNATVTVTVTVVVAALAAGCAAAAPAAPATPAMSAARPAPQPTARVAVAPAAPATDEHPDITTPGGVLPAGMPQVDPDSLSEWFTLERDGVATRHGGVRVELLDAGAGPRQPLRWAADGWSGLVRLDFGTTFAGPTVTGASTFGTDLQVGRGADRDGNLRVILRVDAVTSADDPGASMHQLDDAGAPTIELVVTPRGQLIDVVVDGDDGLRDAADSLAGSFAEASIVPAPVEAISVGARWRTRSLRTMIGLHWLRTTEYTLVRRDGAAVAIAASVEEVMVWPVAGDPADLRRSLAATLAGQGATKLRGTGRNVVELAAGDLLRATGTSELTIELQATMSKAADAAPETVRFTTTARLRSAGATR